MKKEIREIVEEAQRQGWRVEIAKSGHIKLFPPDPTKSLVTLPGSPSDQRWRDNALADMRRRGFRWPPQKKPKKGG